jgi:uncharacterized protein (DUF362 family)/Pyruvate/2-oxoacid:ferredoxin oxidoreductase delta subunit
VNADKSKVAILQCDTYEINTLSQKINEGIELLGGWGQWLKPGMNVLLKVNLIGPLPPESAAVTHCEFVRVLVQAIKKHGCNIWIGDSAGGAIGGKTNTAEGFVVSGLEKVAIEEGAVIKNFDKEGAVEVTTSGGEKMYIAKPMFDADFVVNLPKYKTHMSATYTGAFKNVFGCIPGQKKAHYHKVAEGIKGFGTYICDIHQAVKIGLNIIDGIEAMDKQGPTAGRVYRANKILMGTDVLAVDSAALRMIGLSTEKLPIYAAAIERGIGVWNMDQIEICGDFHMPPKLPGFKMPSASLRQAQEAGISKKALGKMIDLLKTRPQINMNKCKNCDVCVGSCPVGAIDRETKKIDYEKCIECMCCHELCLNKAVDLVNMNPLMRFFKKRNRQTQS